MISSLVWTNLLAWSAEVAVLAGVAMLVSHRWSHARARLLFWQGILAIAILLPVVVPWNQPPIEGIPNISDFQISATTTILSTSPGWSRVLHLDSLLWLLLAGALMRLGWIAVGLLRLRSMRRKATLVQDPTGFLCAPSVRWYVSDEVAGPVTYGWLRPSILLPARIATLTDAARDAIACHELLHVERRDWLFVLLEELIRAVLWFHPAVWLALSKIQLAREQAVDEEVVRRTSDRDAYVDALIGVAAQSIASDVAPAPLFLRKRQLAARITAVLKDASDSKPVLIARSLGAVSAAMAAVVLAVWLFPLKSEAQYQPDDPGITIDAGGTLLHRGPLHYPAGSSGGLVIIDATLNRTGEVSDARVVSGPEELRRESLSGVLGWHYSAEGGAAAGTRISVQFGPRTTAVPPPPPPPPGADRTNRLRRVEGRNGVLNSISFPPGMSPDLKQRIESRLPFRVGDPIEIGKSGAAINEMLRGVDEHLGYVVHEKDGKLDILVGFRDQANRILLPAPLSGGIETVASAPPPPPPPPPPPFVDNPQLVPPRPPPPRVAEAPKLSRINVGNAVQAASVLPSGPIEPGQIRVGGNVQSMNLVEKVTPVYPPLAKQARIQGTVRFTATIGKDGRVISLDVVEGHPLLVEAATDAVKQWVYRPTLLNGNPVEVVTQIDVNFTLSQ